MNAIIPAPARDAQGPPCSIKELLLLTPGKLNMGLEQINFEILYSKFASGGQRD